MESAHKAKEKNRKKIEKAHKNHVFMTFFTGGSIIAIVGVLYCLLLSIREENQANFLAQFMGKEKNQKNREGFNMISFNNNHKNK